MADATVIEFPADDDAVVRRALRTAFPELKFDRDTFAEIVRLYQRKYKPVREGEIA